MPYRKEWQQKDTTPTRAQPSGLNGLDAWTRRQATTVICHHSSDVACLRNASQVVASTHTATFATSAAADPALRLSLLVATTAFAALSVTECPA